MIELCSMGHTVYFLKSQSPIVYRLYITRKVVESVFLTDPSNKTNDAGV